MLRILVLLSMASVLGACASHSQSLPKCDGYTRRPLNRAMWQWEDDDKLSRQQSNRAGAPAGTPPAYVEEEMSDAPAAFAHFDVTGSYRPCTGQS
ncbi:hypothetical protein ACXHXG_24440 [Rhizobium sp. LEGMi198b]